MTITSPHNDKLKEIRKLARRRARQQSGRFVAEGEDLLAAADAAGWESVERYVAAGSGLDGVAVEPELLASVSQLGSGTRALAVYQQRWAPAPAGPLCVALHGIADPGNVGTIVRSAHAFGAASVALGPGCADPYGPKAVRATMGALFSVPLARWGGGRAAAGALSSPQPAQADASALPAAGETGAARADADGGGEAGAGADVLVAALPGTTVALDAHEGEPLAALPDALRAAAAPGGDGLTLVVGAERAGLPDELRAACDRVARIPIAAESLNAAMAATVALYEVTRNVDASDHRMSAP